MGRGGTRGEGRLIGWIVKVSWSFLLGRLLSEVVGT